jgi:hypothetical protein
MKKYLIEKPKALHQLFVIRSYFFVVRYKWVNLEWLDDGIIGVKYTECEPKDAKWQLRVEEPRFKWMRWFGFRNYL